MDNPKKENPTPEERLAVLEKKVKDLVTENTNLKSLIVEKENTIKEMRITALTSELDAIMPNNSVEKEKEEIVFNFNY